jgi:hypothetical protein
MDLAVLGVPFASSANNMYGPGGTVPVSAGMVSVCVVPLLLLVGVSGIRR